MVLDKRCGDENLTAKPDSPVAGGTGREDSTVKKDDDDDDEDTTSAKPDSPGAGDARRDDDSPKKDGDDNDDEDANGKPNSPGTRDESHDNSTSKKDDDEEATAKPHTTRKIIEIPDSPSRASDLFIAVYDSHFLFCDVEGDGSCLFSASANIPGTQFTSGEEVRRAIMKFVTNGRLGEFSIGNDTRMTLQLFCALT